MYNSNIISSFAVLFKAQRDKAVVILKKSCGARAPPGPNHPTPMIKCEYEYE